VSDADDDDDEAVADGGDDDGVVVVDDDGGGEEVNAYHQRPPVERGTSWEVQSPRDDSLRGGHRHDRGRLHRHRQYEHYHHLRGNHSDWMCVIDWM